LGPAAAADVNVTAVSATSTALVLTFIALLLSGRERLPSPSSA
jgi:hypothetical protein